MLDWLGQILEALGLGSLWQYLKQGSENKGQKIPYQKGSIEEKSDTKVVRHDNRQHRLRKVIPKREIGAKVQLLGLRKRDFRRVKNACNLLIESGEQITGIGMDDTGVKIVCLSGREKVIEIS